MSIVYRLALPGGREKFPVNLETAVKAIVREPQARIETEDGRTVLSLADLLTQDEQEVQA